MLTSELDYPLDPAHIAQEPAEPRDSSRLMVVDVAAGSIEHRCFREILEYFRAEDCLAYNDSRVIPARLPGRKMPTGAKVELLLLERRGDDEWSALVKPSKRVSPGTELSLAEDDSFRATVLERVGRGEWLVRLASDGGPTDDAIHRFGEMPLPPYIKSRESEPERYQTVYARPEGSVAAPTAGLHFTPELMAGIAECGVVMAPLTLHVGLDTFQPVKEECLEEHRIHSERIELSRASAEAVNACRGAGRRVFAAGTTTARTLESCAGESGLVSPYSGPTELFITPGYRFRAVDCLLTNFHLPRTTLLAMVFAFAGRELILDAYALAQRDGYRFFSFGDAMLLLGHSAG